MPNYTYIDENVILSYFETGDFPTQAQFAAAWTSYWHKSATIPQSSIENLSLTLQGFADKTLFETHLQDADAHSNILLKLDASNITDIYREQLRTALGVGDVPNNVALVDVGESQDVFNKSQINELCLLIADFVTGGKIRADKIEALGLTEIHEVTETSLAAFAANSANYDFEKNDIIAVPDNVGNFALYIFKGGVKTATGNYLPTGLTNITIGMVEGLQSALDGKMSKPTGTGNFFARTNGANTSWVQISPASFYLLLWDGSDFQTSTIYQTNNKLGIGTQTPSEVLDVNGRVRAKAFVFDNNTEILPNQITLDGSHFWGAAANGVRRPFLFGDYEDIYATMSTFTPTQNLAIAGILGGGNGSPGNPSVNLISPPLVQNQYNVDDYILLRGSNLYLGNQSKVEILASDKTTVIAVIPDNQVQQYTDGLTLVFYYNFSGLVVGQYFIRLTSGVKVYTTSLDLKIVNSVTNIDVNAITWEKNYDAAITPDVNDSAIGANFSITTPAGNTSTNIVSLKSSEIFAQGEDFYLEMQIAVQFSNFDYPQGLNPALTTFGLGYSNTINSLLNNSLVNYNFYTDYYYYIRHKNNEILMGQELLALPRTVNIVFIKTGNLFRTIIGNFNHSITLSNNSGYSVFYQAVGRNVAHTVQGKIIKAFKFN